jgi:hypothetical protein
MTRTTLTILALAVPLSLASCGGKNGTDGDADAVDDAIDVLEETDDPADDPAPEPVVDVEEEDDPADDAEDVEEEDGAIPEPDLLLVHGVAGDYSAGSYSVVALDDLTVHADIDTMHTDGKALCLDGRMFVNELSGADTVDPIATADPWAVIDRHDVGDATNPVDAILRDATHMLVVQYDAAGLVELDLSSGSLTGTTLDLSAFDENDDLPQAHAIAHVGSRYFVSLQRLDGWTASDPGLVIVLDDTSLELVDADPSTTGVVDPIVLPGNNPIGRFRTLGTDLYVALVGAWGSTDGGIARIDTTALTASWTIQGSAIGGDPVFGDCWEIVDASTAYVCYGKEDGSADAVKSFVPNAGTAGSTDVLTASANALSGSALSPDGRMFVGDRDATSPGLRIIDTSASTETTTSPLSVGTNAPYAMCVHVVE